MSNKKLYTQEEFDLDNGLKQTFGDYDTYKNFVGTVYNKEQPTQPKTRFDTYMDEATRLYNEGVQANNKVAETQSAQALAQYNEVNRFANELNKGTGKANTGYAGDNSIDAYNAYRNSVNASWENANKQNNDLYSYYMQEMRNIENEKVAEEQATDTTNWNKVYGEGGFKDEFERYIEASPNDVLYDNGNIKPEEAQKWWDYAKSYFGGEDNIPEYAKGVLKTQAGFSEWLDAYNKGTTDNTYATENEKTNIGINKLVKVDASGNVATEGKDFAVISAEKGGGSGEVEDLAKNNFRVSLDGKVYYVETSGKIANAPSSIASAMDSNIERAKGRVSQEGDMCYYDGKIYVKTSGNTWKQVEGREGWFSSGKNGNGYDDLLKAVKQSLGLYVQESQPQPQQNQTSSTKKVVTHHR